MELDIHELSRADLLNSQSRPSVGQRAKVKEATNNQRQHHNSGNDVGPVLLLRELLALFGNVHLAKDEVKQATSQVRSRKVGGQVVMQELLSAHKEKWEVMCCPTNKEEAKRVVQLVSSRVFQRVNVSSTTKLVCKQNTEVHGDERDLKPPANEITGKVDLSSILVFSPEGDAANEEGPRQRLRGVGVLLGQGVVLGKHARLQLKVLLEEGHCLALLGNVLQALRVGQISDLIKVPVVGTLIDASCYH